MIGGFNISNNDPVDSRMYVADISHIFLADNWTDVKPYPGLIVSDPNGEVRVCVNSDYTLASSWKKIGGGSLPVDTYKDAIDQAAADNIGQLFYVKKTTYKKGDGYTEVESEADKDTDGKIVAEYTAGPYIVTGTNTVAKLGTTSATGNIAGDVEVLKGRVGTVEDKVEANEDAIESLRDAIAGGVHFRDIFESLPTIEISDNGEYYSQIGEEIIIWNIGDIIIVITSSDESESSKEYILATDSTGLPNWVELGDISPASEKIAKVEKDFTDHVSEMNTKWTNHVNAYNQDKATFALKTDIQGINQNLTNYVQKDGNKVLSTNDYTTAEKTKLGNIAENAQVNVIESVKVNNAELTVTGKSINIDLSSYAKDADKVNKTTTINDQPLTNNITLDAQDIKTIATIGSDNAGSTVEQVLTTLNTKIGSVATTANNAVQEVYGSNAISVTNKNTVSVKVKTNSAIQVTTEGLDLVWETV